MKVLVYGPGFSSFRQLPEWDYAPTGKVSFEFDLYLRYPSALRRSFKDAKIQRLENMANDVAVGLAVLVAAKREDARRAEEDRLRAEEAARRRNEAKRLAYIEERRLKRSEEHTSELQSLMRISYAGIRLKKKKYR